MPEPQQRLPAAALVYWRVSLGLWALLAVLIAAGLEQPADEAGISGWVLVTVAAVGGVVVTAVVPRVRWRRWRYEIRENEIDLRTGLWTVRRTLVPIRRVQHVDTEAGVLQNMFGLASVSFHTAAGATEIPALTREEAEAVRGRVAELTRSRDDV
jgi:uncharacterized protein